MPLFQIDHLRLDRLKDDTLLLWLDVAGRPVNVFNRRVLGDLDAALDRVAGDATAKRLLIASAKPSGFVAGADLHEFAAVKGPEDASDLSALGQRLFQKLADLRIPVMAVIHGPCLGGGLEFALACDYRVVMDHPKTQLGLPEIELGLVPGWGGTQRLPRVIGLERALQVMLGRRRLSAQEALRWGLADIAASPRALPPDDKTLLEFIRVMEVAGSRKRPKQKLPLRTWRQRLLESTSLGRSLMLRGAERTLRQRVPDDMPAPWEALDAVRLGITLGMEAGLAFEREAIGRLAATPACRNLVTLFFLHERARRGPPSMDGRSIREIRRVGVVGAGTMGAGIAQLAAVRGFEIIVQEVNEAALAAGMQKIEVLFRKASERGVISAEEAEQKLNAIGRTTTWQGFDRLDLVIEAVVEDLVLKKKVFRELENQARPDTILATNTSSLSVARLQEGLARPQRVAGLHFFNPVHKMPLVEVVRAAETSEDVVLSLTRWAAVLGKTPVVVKDSPGFVVNRILIPYLNEAVLLVGEGMAVEKVDQAMRRFGMPVGPLELLDQVGLDVAAQIARSMQPFVGDRFPPNPVFERMAERGWLGAKRGLGFYRYKGKKKKPHPGGVELIHSSIKSSTPSLTAALPPAAQLREARERMVGLMINEAAACLSEGIAADAETIDLAMVFGTGWAPHRGGPLRHADDRGIGEVVGVLEELARRLGPRFAPCEELRRRAEANEKFYVLVATEAASVQPAGR